jgi:hypothetical protein
MLNRDKLPKVADAHREGQYGYVFGVSGPGMMRKKNLFISLNYFIG